MKSKIDSVGTTEIKILFYNSSQAVSWIFLIFFYILCELYRLYFNVFFLNKIIIIIIPNVIFLFSMGTTWKLINTSTDLTESEAHIIIYNPWNR